MPVTGSATNPPWPHRPGWAWLGQAEPALQGPQQNTKHPWEILTTAWMEMEMETTVHVAPCSALQGQAAHGCCVPGCCPQV